MDEKKTGAWMARERKWQQEYLAKLEAEGTIPTRRRELADYAAGKATVGYGSTALDHLAIFHGALGSEKVLAGDAGGFVDIDLACLENFWMIRLLTRGYDLDQRPGKRHRILMDRVATCWMHAEAVGATAIRTSLDALLARVVDGHGSVGGKHMNALCTLTAHYATGTDVAALERSGWAKIGGYASAVARSLRASEYDDLATLHQKGVDGAGFPPFHSYPYRLVPFELQAIAKRTGVAVAGHHPLLTSPLARSREVPDIAMTDDLRALAASAAPEVTLE